MLAAIIGTLTILGVIAATEPSRRPKPPAPPDTCYIRTMEKLVWHGRDWVLVAAERDTTCIGQDGDK